MIIPKHYDEQWLWVLLDSVRERSTYMERSTTLKSRRLVAVPIALLAVLAGAVISVVRVPAQSTDPLANVGIINIIGVRAGSTAPFFIKGEPFGNGVWQRLGQPVLGNTFAMIPSAGTFAGAGCQGEYGQAQIVANDGSTLVYNLVGYRCALYAGGSTTNGLYDIVSGTGRFADFKAGGGIFSIDERADGLAFLALSGMHCGHSCVGQ
jgi:hypothetical protein